MGPMGELGALFNPGMRHEQEERRSKALQREEEGDSREVDPRIDLESGVAVITTGDQDSGEPTTAAGESAVRPGRSSSSAAPARSDGGNDSAAGAAPAGAAGSDASDATAAASDSGAVTVPARPRPRGKRGLAARSR